MLGRLAVSGSLGIWSAAKLLVGEMAHTHQGLGDAGRRLREHPNCHPFPKRLCANSPVSRRSHQGGLEPQLQEEPAEPSKDAAGTEPVCRKQGCIDTQDFIAKAPVPPDLSQTLGRGSKGRQGLTGATASLEVRP